MNQIKRVGFYGATGSYDFGDFAMVVCNIKKIYIINSDVEFIIFTPNLVTTQKYIQSNINDVGLLNRIEYFSDELFIINAFDNACNKLEQLIRGKSHNKHRQFFKSRKCWKSSMNGKIGAFPKQLIEKLGSLDIMVFNGGGYLQNSWRYFNICFMAYVNLCYSLNKPIYFLGNSFGPFKKIYEPYISQSMKFVNKIIVRDGTEYSAVRLKNMGLDTSKILINTDDLIYEPRGKVSSEPYIVIEIMWMIVTSSRGEEKILNEILNFAKYATDKGYRVWCPLFDIDDEIALKCYRYLKDKLGDVCSIYDDCLNIEGIFELFANASFSISMKYHPVVLSLANNVPCMGVICGGDGYYQSKMRGVFESLNIDPDDKIITIDEIYAEKLIYIFDNVSVDIDKTFVNQLKERHMSIVSEIAESH